MPEFRLDLLNLGAIATAHRQRQTLLQPRDAPAYVRLHRRLLELQDAIEGALPEMQGMITAIRCAAASVSHAADAPKRAQPVADADADARAAGAARRP